VNFDGIIAAYNVRHCRELTGEGADLDLGYLRALGPEAAPAAYRAGDHLPDRDKAERALEIARTLEAELAGDLNNWRGWTWRRHRTANAVERMAEAGAAP